MHTQETLSHYRGSLRQFLQEDKGVTLIGCFGLPMLSSDKDALRYALNRTLRSLARTYVTHMFSCRCVKAAVSMQHEFKKQNLKAFIGITTGKSFCGMVGSAQRSEYAVVGPSVNLSARLMVAAASLLSKDPGMGKKTPLNRGYSSYTLFVSIS